MIKTTCPECDQDVRMETQPNMGEHVVCSACKTTLVVIRVTPVRLDWAFKDPFDHLLSNHEGTFTKI
jgi:lysine biosynthesis protein LysW